MLPMEAAAVVEVLPDVQIGRRAIVVIDVVESVRQMQADEAAAIDRWRRFVHETRVRLLGHPDGRLVKSLGDGLLVEFSDVRAAVAFAADAHARAADANAGLAASAHMRLRAGLHVAEVVIDQLDIYGAGVNLAARLASLAGPGETVVSAEVRDCVANGVDGFLCDLGECFLKHYAHPIRAWRINSVDNAGRKQDAAYPHDDLRPAVAVIPLSGRADNGEGLFGDVIADGIIDSLSKSADLKIISRLSTRTLRTASLESIRDLLHVQYVVWGSYRRAGTKYIVRIELCDAADGRVIWADSAAAVAISADWLQATASAFDGIVMGICGAITRCEVHRARGFAIPSLAGHTAYVSGVSMLHGLAGGDFRRARELFEHLTVQHPRSPAPWAMLAKWHVLSQLQGSSSDAQQAAAQAQDCARRAVDADDSHALSLAMEGLATLHSSGDLDRAEESGQRSIEANPSEASAWMVKAGVHCYRDEAAEAEAASLHALSLSPLDPARFMFEVFIGASKLSAGKLDEAIEWAGASLQANSRHAAALRLMTIACSLSDRPAQARRSAAELMKVYPEFRVSEYERRYPGRHSAHCAVYMRALQSAGVPA